MGGRKASLAWLLPAKMLARIVVHVVGWLLRQPMIHRQCQLEPKPAEKTGNLVFKGVVNSNLLYSLKEERDGRGKVGVHTRRKKAGY
jgi:hypothetical protein